MWVSRRDLLPEGRHDNVGTDVFRDKSLDRSDPEVVVEAKKRAENIIAEAERAANRRQKEADDHSREVLHNLEEKISQLIHIIIDSFFLSIIISFK